MIQEQRGAEMKSVLIGATLLIACDVPYYTVPNRVLEQARSIQPAADSQVIVSATRIHDRKPVRLRLTAIEDSLRPSHNGSTQVMTTDYREVKKAGIAVIILGGVQLVAGAATVISLFPAGRSGDAQYLNRAIGLLYGLPFMLSGMSGVIAGGLTVRSSTRPEEEYRP